MPSTKLKQLGLSLVLALVTAVTYADQALDEFFENLRTTTSEQEARDTERAIWAIWHNPGDESLRKLYRQGQNLMSAGRLTEAQNTFPELIIRAPGFAEAWNQRATAFYFSNDYDASLADIDHTLTLEPRHYGTLFGKALIFTALAKYAWHRKAALPYRKWNVEPRYLTSLAIHMRLAKLLKGVDRDE